VAPQAPGSRDRRAGRMLGVEILRALPRSVPSLVLFRLDALRPLVDEDATRRMFGLPDGLELRALTHVALTGFGPLVARDDGQIMHPRLGAPPPVGEAQSLYADYAPWLASLPAAEPDCLGVGRLDGHHPVALHVQIEGTEAYGVAAFARRPSYRDYELLRAVGVEHLGGEERGGMYLVRFRNQLEQHLLAGRLAGFARTDHCNLFFLGGGEIGEPVARGLGEAATARIADGLGRVRAAIARLVTHADMRRIALLCVPPPPAMPAPYGDLVALGFALAALRAGSETGAEADAVARRLLMQRIGGLWSYHTGGLPTATDTALVMQGFDDVDPAALEIFRTDDGGYVPQLWASQREPLRMQASQATWHWRQPDVATTALVVALRRRAGLAADGSVEWLAERFDRRSGLFFANPYLTDWALSSALDPGDPRVSALRRRLRAEIGASVRADHAFGEYDQALCTALAILALANLGEHGRIIRLAQLRLLDWIQDDDRLPATTPFYSSLDLGMNLGTDAHGDGSCEVPIGGRVHAITYYRDAVGVITSALAALALAVPADHSESPSNDGPCHPRYACGDSGSYVARFALPPYLEGDARGTAVAVAAR
jgi:hypothetical protein